jgi:FlaG/FlaF family flagellin (archaellin)
LDDTRHGHTLSGIFRARLAAAASSSSNSSEEEEKNEEDEHGGEEENVESSSSSSKRITLILTVPVAVDEEKVMNDLYAIFLSAKAEVDSDEDLNDLYDVQIAIVDSQESMQKVMNDATQAALQSSTTTKPINIISTLSTIYTKISSSTSEPSPSVAAAILACDDSFALHYRRARSKLSSWKARTKRGLVVDNFGSQSMALLKRTMELYDKDTISASGLVAAAPYRMEMRNKLQGRIEADMKDLFKVQVEILDKLALKNFQSVLLRKYTKSDGNIEAFYNENAVAVRSAAFAFDTAMDELEVPTLGLFKGKASQEVANKLNAALLSFPDSPAARLKGLKEVKKVVSKNKKPTERSIDLGFDLVAMIRPDGFGNFQGFAGYQLGGNNVIVGVHNDADSPDVIAQFGGVRPPFLRFQPKLKIDVEL